MKVFAIVGIVVVFGFAIIGVIFTGLLIASALKISSNQSRKDDAE